MNLKQRILTGWTFSRILYLVIGSAIVVQGIEAMEWIGIVFGGYFAAMGLFAFGCASGNCFGGSCERDEESTKNVENVVHEETSIK